MASTNETSAAATAKTISDTAAKVKKGAGQAGDDFTDKAEEIAASAQEALEQMRRIIDEFAAKTGGSAAEAVKTAREKAGETADCLAGSLNGVSALGQDAIDSLSTAVAKRPMTAVLAALGVGLVIGFISRGGSRE